MTAPVAVAVVSWNTRDLLERCLRSLAPEAEAGRAEVWVVDNGSDDGSPETVRERFPWATLVESAENLGFGRAVNLVARRTSTPWLAPANADVALLPGALEALLEAGHRHPEAAAIAPRLVLPEGVTQHSVYAFPTLGRVAAFALGLPAVVPGLGDRLCLEGRWNPWRARRVDWAVAAFLLVRRDAFDAVGGFSADQWLFAEDLDLGWRLSRAGWATRYEPRAAVHHAHGAATAQVFGEHTTEVWMRSTYAWLERRRGARFARTIAAVHLAGAAARSAALAPAVRWAPARFGWRRERARRWVSIHKAALRSGAVEDGGPGPGRRAPVC